MPSNATPTRELRRGDVNQDGTVDSGAVPSNATPMPISRGYSMGSNGKLYVVGGRDQDGARLASAECYDPDCGTWEKLAAMNIPRSGLAAVSLGGALYVMGGADNQARPLSSVERFDL